MAGNLGAESRRRWQRGPSKPKLDAERPPTLMKDLTEEINALLKAFDSSEITHCSSPRQVCTRRALSIQG